MRSWHWGVAPVSILHWPIIFDFIIYTELSSEDTYNNQYQDEGSQESRITSFPSHVWLVPTIPWIILPTVTVLCIGRTDLFLFRVMFRSLVLFIYTRRKKGRPP